MLWIEDLVKETRDPSGTPDVVGVDVGTGASAIYPLLCCQLQSTWKFYALEADPVSLKHAQDNIGLNDLDDRITTLHSDVEDPSLLTQHEFFKRSDNVLATFTMCNPPFYESAEDIQRSAEAKSEEASGSCTGSLAEMITPGGEIAFTKLLIQESLILRTKVQWYTTMLGKISSIRASIDTLKSHEINNYIVTEFLQGKTRRWAIGWSFAPWRPLPMTSRGCESSQLQDLLPLNPSYTITLANNGDPSTRLSEFFDRSSIEWEWIQVKRSMSAYIYENTWSRQARRRLDKLKHNETKEMNVEEEMKSITMRIELTYDSDHKHAEVLWRYGLDFVLWESLCGKLKQLLLK